MGKRKLFAWKELESLIGSLQQVCTIIRPGKFFMRNAIPLVKGANQSHHHIHLSLEFHSDLAWWKLFATSWNGKTLIIPPHSVQHHFISDTSRSQGAGLGSRATEFPYHGIKCTIYCVHIAITMKEMAPIILATLTWNYL